MIRFLWLTMLLCGCSTVRPLFLASGTEHGASVRVGVQSGQLSAIEIDDRQNGKRGGPGAACSIDGKCCD